MSEKIYDWHTDPPKENGEFFYSGKLPGVDTEVVATSPKTQQRIATLFIPSGWRGSTSSKYPVVHCALLNEWTGRWAGPEFGLSRTGVAS